MNRREFEQWLTSDTTGKLVLDALFAQGEFEAAESELDEAVKGLRDAEQRESNAGGAPNQRDPGEAKAAADAARRRVDCLR